MSSTADYLGGLIRDAGLIELCHMDGGKLDIGWYDNADNLLHDARTMAGTGNLFTTLNRIDRDGIKDYLTEQRRVVPSRTCRTPDSAVVRYSRLFFDLDPERPTDTASTASELTEAAARARRLAARLSALGWPAPAYTMSGNGSHLQYRTALPNTPEVKDQLAAIYTGLHLELSDDVVTFDRTVRNPARLCTLYGSIKRKGPNTADRPHRQSWISIPQDWQQVHPRQVAALADHYARQAPAQRVRAPVAAPRVSGRGDYRTLDAPAWFAAHGFYVRPLIDGVHGVRCPWSSAHSSPSPTNGSDTVLLVRDEGWPGFACKHTHCVDRTIKDVMALWSDADSFCRGAFVREARRV